MTFDPALARLISASLARLSSRSPFFASLALFARIEASDHIPTAATDGKDIFVNPAFFQNLAPGERDAVLLHEVLHAALLHVPRRAGRRGKEWNVAADFVINGMIAAEGYELPEGALRDKNLERLTVEEAYERVVKQAGKYASAVAKMGDPGAEGQPGVSADLLDEAPPDTQSQSEKPGDKEAPSPKTDATTHWQSALRQARVAAESLEIGSVPGNLKRELAHLDQPFIDWRHYLWRFLVQTPTDFTSFDRRFVGQGIYLDTIDGQTLRLLLCVDTSGSINVESLHRLMSEVQGILGAYPHIACDLFFADTRLDGPHPLLPNDPLPTPRGGGGTDFRPFFQYIDSHYDTSRPLVAIYLTDGFGWFPKAPPRYPILWAVTPGGKLSDQFPFGEVIRTG